MNRMGKEEEAYSRIFPDGRMAKKWKKRGEPRIPQRGQANTKKH
jgi:hypothetical protein